MSIAAGNRTPAPPREPAAPIGARPGSDIRPADGLTGALVIAARIGLACLTLILFQSVLWIPAVPQPIRIGLVAYAVLASVNPTAALLTLAGLVPLTGVAPWLGAVGLPRPSEALVLAFLAGWLIRSAWRSRRTPAISGGVQRIAVLLAIAVLASMTVSLATIQAAWTAPQPFWSSLASFLGAGYLGQPGIFRVVPAGFLLVEGLALLTAVPVICREDSRRVRGLVRMSVVAGVAAGLLSLLRVGTAVVRSADPSDIVARVFSGTVRLSAHVADVNAAGSYFVMVGLMAVGATMDAGRWKPLWLAATAVVGAALLLSGSRTALWAGFLVLLVGSWWLAREPSRSLVQRRAGLWVAGFAIGLALVAISIFPDLLFGQRAQSALRMRYAFTQTSLRMLETRPIFGVGLDSYYRRSADFMPQWLKATYERENAHNYFLQIAAELGLVGGLLFVLVVVIPLAQAVNLSRARGSMDFLQRGVVGGMTAFLVTCLSGHPLLLAMVAYPFWMTLGLVIAGTARGTPQDSLAGSREQGELSRTDWSRRLTWLAGALIVLSIVPRTRAEIAQSRLQHVERGFSAWVQGVDGRRYRRIGRQATFHVPGSTLAVRLPFRAGNTADSTPIEVSIALDGTVVNRVVLKDPHWIVVRMLLPPEASARFRRIDLLVSGTESRGGTPDDPGVEIGEVVTEEKIDR